jgi:hypothetical protein
MTSTDAINWTARTSIVGAWQGVTYGNGMFVAVAEDGDNRVATSPDGITWTARTPAEVNAWQEVTYGNGIFVAVASGGTNRVMTSTDAINWTARTSIASAWSSIVYGNGMFVAVASGDTTQVMTSGLVEKYDNPINNIYQGGMTVRSGNVIVNENVGIGTTAPGYKLEVSSSAWFGGYVSAESFIDRTPYPDTLQIAYDSIKSIEKKPEGGVDHEKLNSFVKHEKKWKELVYTNKPVMVEEEKFNEETKSMDIVFVEKIVPEVTGEINHIEVGRDLSATISALTEVVKDLIKRIEVLEKQ